MIQKLQPLPTAKPNRKSAQKHYRVAEVDLPSSDFSARLITKPAELEQILGPWSRLMETAIHPNPFLHPGFLIPAFTHLANKNISVLVVESPQRMNKEGEPVICALFPIQRKRIYGLPLSCLEIWKHDFCFDGTPLLRQDCAAEALEFTLRFMSDSLKTSLFSLGTIINQGPIAKLFSNIIHNQQRTVFHRNEFTRACFQPMEDVEAFINTKVAKNTRKGTQRLRRKLEKMGQVKTEFFVDYDHDLINEFLSLEAAGWKGQIGTALDSHLSTREFFHEMTCRMLSTGNMTLTRTSLEGRPIAMLCDFQQSNFGAQFKIAYDETLRDYSPGLILEIDTIKRLHESSLGFVDSCADPNHSMINRVWSDRVRFHSLVIALRGQVSQFAVSAMPLIQQTKKLFQKKRQNQ